jgi:2-polyprenyl-6-methoxyphenol hydroxylase-like FAD-dependent oxidoreductase
LALEDAIVLVRALTEHDSLPVALEDFQQLRQPIARKIVDAANTSADWYEDFRAKMQLPPLEFAFDYLTRSGRVDMQRLRGISPRFIGQYEHYLAAATSQ